MKAASRTCTRPGQGVRFWSMTRSPFRRIHTSGRPWRLTVRPAGVCGAHLGFGTIDCVVAALQNRSMPISDFHHIHTGAALPNETLGAEYVRIRQ
jgi:hypothetical protein